jgi:predicted glycosyltransferase
MIVPRHFGPDLPFMPDWIERHFDFPGYVLPFDPADYADAERLRHELGLDPTRPLIVASVGGSGIGIHLLRRIAAAFAELRKDLPEARMLLVCGPRIDPGAIEPVDGIRAVGYVHDLFRTLACCDLAVVQGGLTTTMELVANRRPFIYVPLRNHFEQNHHVVHRLRRYRAPAPTGYDEATPERLAELMLERWGAPVDYEPVESGGAGRAARMIVPLLEERKGRTPPHPRHRRPLATKS